MENKSDKKIIILVLIIIISAILVVVLLNTNKENKYKNNDNLAKFQDEFMKGTFYYDKDLEKEVIRYGLLTEWGEVTFTVDNPYSIIVYHVTEKDGTKENFINEYIRNSENGNIKHISTTNTKISKINPIEATKIEFSSKDKGINKMVTYMMFNDKNVYYFNYISGENKEIEEFKTMLDSFVVE